LARSSLDWIPFDRDFHFVLTTWYRHSSKEKLAFSDELWDFTNANTIDSHDDPLGIVLAGREFDGEDTRLLQVRYLDGRS